jgi:hypothetical protein
MALSPSSTEEKEESSKPPSGHLCSDSGRGCRCPAVRLCDRHPLVLKDQEHQDASSTAEALTGLRLILLPMRTLNTSDFWPLRMTPGIVSVSLPHRVPLMRKVWGQWVDVGPVDWSHKSRDDVFQSLEVTSSSSKGMCQAQGSPRASHKRCCSTPLYLVNGYCIRLHGAPCLGGSTYYAFWVI